MRDLIASLTAVLHELLGQYDTVFHKSTRARVVEVTQKRLDLKGLQQAGLGLAKGGSCMHQPLWLFYKPYSELSRIPADQPPASFSSKS